MTVSISKGFTMVELMITISIASILLAVAVPGYQSLMRESRLTAQANELMTALHYARSEAVKRGGRITICKSPDGATCNDGSWQDGWLVFSDAGMAGAVDSDDEILRVFPKLNGSSLKGGGNFSSRISYLRNGRSQGNNNLPNGTFTLCNQNDARKIVINVSGRARVEKAGCPSNKEFLDESKNDG
ncbi:prepilin-type N-terminal cleavage/methylation domain-containing protein [Nitrosomonas sp. GH22]|uniref:GspH/FimT family pseudopilin n=1 Tax=Nitrosomonas sp. GH22 TaxID=153947 RepID=UPI00136F18BF|nr:Tfp pilus assembly protein FimT/FimU [Nitrosomonas sp. GH22]MXS80688.1 prepilin-type N-terminal cleavage/methylation domain-containing protein [Nitrosomonas sp. GH22]